MEELRISDLKTVRNGYDKTQVAMLIKQLIEQAKREKETAVQEALESREAELQSAFRQREEELRTAMNTAVEKARRETAAQVQAQSKPAQPQPNPAEQAELERLRQWVERMTDAWNKQADYTKELDTELRKYLVREKELSEKEETIQLRMQQAETEAKEITAKAQAQVELMLEDAAKQQKRMEMDASLNADNIVKSAHRKADEILASVDQEQNRIVRQKTQAVRTIWDDYMGTLNKAQALLEELQTRSQAALREEGRKQPVLE